MQNIDLKRLTDQELIDLKKTTAQKVKEYHGYSASIKIVLNGGYGALSNEHNRWYSDDLAESITLTGQLSVKWVARDLNIFLNKTLKTQADDYVVAIDTDSAYIKVDKAIEMMFPGAEYTQDQLMDKLEKFAAKVEDVIQASVQSLYDEINSFDAALHMKLEAIGPAIWIAKKRYIMSLMSFKGVRLNPPKIKVQGIEAVRSSTPAACRVWIKEAIPIIMEGDERKLKDFLNEKRELFIAMPFDQVAFPRSANNLEMYEHHETIYRKATPAQVRAALLYNDQVRAHDLQNSLPLINSGDKIRFCYMRLPNPLFENIFGSPDNLPDEFGLEQYIDYNKQFDKAFALPLQKIFKAAGMNVSDNIDISQFFTDDAIFGVGHNGGPPMFQEYEDDIDLEISDEEVDLLDGWE